MSEKLRQEIRPCDEDEIANELANFFFGLWQRGYRKLSNKEHQTQIENDKAVALASGFAHKGGLPAA